jgi:hypothetical protein
MVCKGEHSRFFILGGARVIDPHLTGREVHLAPRRRQDFGVDPPAARHVIEFRDVPEGRIEMVPYPHEVGKLEEPFSRLLGLLQLRDMRAVDDLVVLLGQCEHPAEHRRPRLIWAFDGLRRTSGTTVTVPLGFRIVRSRLTTRSSDRRRLRYALIVIVLSRTSTSWRADRQAACVADVDSRLCRFCSKRLTDGTGYP